MNFTQLLSKLTKDFQKVKIIYDNNTSEIWELAKIDKNTIKTKNLLGNIRIENLKSEIPMYDPTTDTAKNETLFDVFSRNNYEIK